MSYSMSTNSNPFCQGGWQPHMTIEQSPTWFNTTNDSQPAYSDLPGPTSAGVRELSSTFTAIDSNSTTLTTPATPRSTTYRLIPSPSNSSSVNGHTSYALLSPNNRIMYTIASVGPCLTLVKDSRGRPTALLESSANPCVDIRGGRGKKRVDEWLMHDITNPQVSSISLWNHRCLIQLWIQMPAIHVLGWRVVLLGHRRQQYICKPPKDNVLECGC